MMKYQKILLLICIIFFIPPNYVLKAQRTKSSTNSGEQRFSEKGLRDNRHFFYFINPTLSNFGDIDDTALFKKAIQRDIISQILYMKFIFHDSFTEIRKVQEILITLYTKTIIKEHETAKKLLNNYAPEVIKSNKYINKHYLELGYKNLVGSKQFMVMADNFKENLFSLKLYQYIKAIKKAKLAKRYAILSLLFTRFDKKRDLKNYKHYNFDDLEKLILEMDQDSKENLLLLHYDNYYKVKDKVSFYDKIWLEPNLQEIDEYKEYFNKK